MGGRQHLTKLQQMCIGKTKFHGVQGHKIICIPVSCSNQLQMAPSLVHLTSLKLRGWPKLKSLPQQIQHPTSLTFLKIDSFDGVETLPKWLGCLTFLTNMEISHSKNLTNSPSVQAMQRLTKLRTLVITGCHPLLKQKMQQGQRHRLAHDFSHSIYLCLLSQTIVGWKVGSTLPNYHKCVLGKPNFMVGKATIIPVLCTNGSKWRELSH